MICIACENEHQENFCPNCGERAGIPKITFKSMFTEAFSTITNMDKGFLLNLKYLTLNPKQLVTSYLQGKRKGIYNPISFLILSVTIYLIVDAFLNVPPDNIGSNIDRPRKGSLFYEIGARAGEFLYSYLKYFWLLTIFWLGASTKIMFGKYNFAEHLTISSFAIGYATLLGLIGRFFFNWVLFLNPLIYFVVLLIIYQIFKNENDKVGSFIQALVAVILFTIQLFFIAIGIGVMST